MSRTHGVGLLFILVTAAGCGEQMVGWPLVQATDDTPPAVVTTDPADLDNGVPLDAAVAAVFSERMDRGTIDGDTFQLRGVSGELLPGVVYFDSDTFTATFVPAEPLLPGVEYTATMGDTAADPAGNPLAADVVWTFTADASSLDLTPPTVVSTDPVDLGANVPVDVLPSVRFSEGMDPATVDETSVTLEDEFGAAVPASVFYDSPTQSATLVPEAPLVGEHTYVVWVADSVADRSGVVMADPYSWSFSTADASAPWVVATVPEDVAGDVAVDTAITFTFNDTMDPLTVLGAEFELVAPDGGVASGVLAYDATSRTASFLPSVALNGGSTYIGRVLTGVTDAGGNAMGAEYEWSFTTLSEVWALDRVELGTLDTFVAVAGAGLTNSNSAGVTTLDGDVALSPTGTCLGDGVPCTATNPAILGTLYVNDATAAQAKVDLTVAWVDAMSRPVGTLEADLAGKALPPGVYTSASSMMVAVGGVVTLDGEGDPNAVWIFQVGSDLTVGNNVEVVLINGAQAKNVFWAVFSSSTLGSGVSFQGSVLAGASNSVGTNSTVVGRLLAGTGALTLLADTITLP